MEGAGWLRPIISLPGLADRYDPHELESLLDSLFRRTQPVVEVAKDMSPILSAYPRCHCDALAILDLVRSDRLTFVGRLPDVCGIPALVIRPEEVVDLLGGPRLQGYRHGDMRRILGLNCLTVAWLLKTGHVAHEQHRNPRTRKIVQIVPRAALDAFMREFVTLSQIARQERTLPKHAAARLARRGIHPIDLPARCSRIYRRADLDTH